MTDTVLIALLAAVPPTLVALGALVQAMRTHRLVNSRMDELLALTKQQAGEAATLAEKGAQLAREEDAVAGRAAHDKQAP